MDAPKINKVPPKIGSAFEQLAAMIHRQHAIASGVLSWRKCDYPICFKARRLTR